MLGVVDVRVHWCKCQCAVLYDGGVSSGVRQPHELAFHISLPTVPAENDKFKLREQPHQSLQNVRLRRLSTHVRPRMPCFTLRTLMRQQQLRPALPRIKHQCLFGFFGTTLMSFPMPSTEAPRPSLLTCGDAEAYRRIVLINGMGPCLGTIIDAFPLPTYMLSATLPGSSRKFADMLKGGMRCALTHASYMHDTNCRGNVARCYSLRQTSDFGDCASATGTSCSTGCRDRLAALGSTSSTSPAKCCVKWFQQQSTAEDCDAKVSLSSVMGPACVAFMRSAMPAPSPSQPGQPTPDQMNMMFTMPLFPGPCAAKSAESLAVSNCNVPVAGLQAACPSDDTPFVLSSLFAPKKTTTATITFTSSSLKAVSGCICPCCFPLLPSHLCTPHDVTTAQVMSTKYAETLKAIQKALETKVHTTKLARFLS